MSNHGSSSAVKLGTRFASDDCCSIFTHRKRRTGPTGQVTGVGSETEETVKTICDVEPMPKPGGATLRKSNSKERNPVNLSGSTTKTNSHENALRQQATTKFEATLKRLQEIAGDQTVAQPLFNAAIDYDPIRNVHKLAMEIERYVLLFKEQRSAQKGNRSHAESFKHSLNTVLKTTAGIIGAGSAVAAVRFPENGFIDIFEGVLTEHRLRLGFRDRKLSCKCINPSIDSLLTRITGCE